MALSFAIDTSKGETFDSAKNKRRQADMLAQSILGRAPKNVGEGLNSIGQAMIYRMLMNESGAAEQAGLASASDTMGSIFGGFPAAPSAGGGSGPVASSDPSVSPNVNVGSTIDFARGERGHGGSPYRDAIASIESAGSGDYSAIGPTHKTLGRALGRYQVMEANIGPWSKAALGREVTADEFLADKGIQDTIFDHRFGGYVKQFGNPQDAASAWFTGQPLAQGANKKDVLGTTGTAYVDKFTKALPQGGVTPAPVQVASLDPSIGMPAAGPVPSEYSSMGLTPDAWQRMNAPDGAQPAPALPAPRMVPDLPVAAPQPAPAPQQVAQAQDPSSLPVTAGGTAGAIQPGQSSGPSLQQLLQAAQNPWLNDNQRQVVNMLLEQEMQKQDPMRQLELEKGQLEIEKLRKGDPMAALQQEKLRRELATPPERKTAVINGRLVDTQDGKAIAEFPDQEKPTSDIQEYEYAKERGYTGTFVDFQLAQRKAGATSVTTNVGEGDKFYENLDKKNAETFAALSEEGVRGNAKLGQIERLEGLLATSPQGAAAMLKQAAGEYGINTEGLSDIQAAQALINELVPQQRQPGSGPMSDADLALFKQSLPRLINQPGGNQTIINTMRGITQYQIQMGQIADAVADRDMSPKEAREAIRALPNPLAAFGKPKQDEAVPEGVDPEDWKFMDEGSRRLFQ